MRQCPSLHVDDDARLVSAVALDDRHAMVGRSLDHGPETMTSGVDGLAVKDAVRERVGADRHVDGPGDESLDVVDVQALVDPGTDTYKVIQIVEKIANALIAGFSGASDPEEIAKQISLQLDSVAKTAESIDNAADRALAEKFRDKD